MPFPYCFSLQKLWRSNYYFVAGVLVLPDELVVVVVLVLDFPVPEPLGLVSSPQPTMMPRPNSITNAKTFFIFSPQNKCSICSPSGTSPSSSLRSRGLGFYSLDSYNFFQNSPKGGVKRQKTLPTLAPQVVLRDFRGFFPLSGNKPACQAL